jgi:hypothetical protein
MIGFHWKIIRAFTITISKFDRISITIFNLLSYYMFESIFTNTRSFYNSIPFCIDMANRFSPIVLISASIVTQARQIQIPGQSILMEGRKSLVKCVW